MWLLRFLIAIALVVTLSGVRSGHPSRTAAMQAVVSALALPLPSTASSLLTASTGAYAQLSHATLPEGESTFIPITSRGASGDPITLRLEATLYRPNPKMFQSCG